MTMTMSQPPGLSPEAKSRLAAVVRSLRERLLKDLGDAVQSTYRLALPLEEAGLGEKIERRRRRLEARLDEEARGGARGAKETPAQARERHLSGAIKSAAATMLNRLVVLRQAEALNMVRVKVLSGGWQSPGYREFRAFAPALLVDDTEGYAELLRLVFEEWALDLPGLFGEVGLSGLVPVPAATLRAAVEALEDPALAPAWTDDTTLGWVYQFWNDPDREALDEKIRNRGKIENHELAAKTQLFTDRYMVEWLLQNSLGQVWFGICARNGWTPEVVQPREGGPGGPQGTLDRLEAARAEWRAKREAGQVDPEALMPLPGAERPDLGDLEQEERWKYWVPRELPAPASPGAGCEGSADHAPASVREVKLLDPACGSGHFLVIAFELLAALYQEEARQRRAAGEALVEEEWTPEAIAASLLERNLHGIDLDPRAVQIAAAALWLKARTWCREGQPSARAAGLRPFGALPGLRLKTLNLVASNLGLAALPQDDPALMELVAAVEAETGIPGHLTRQVVEALKGADHLGSLLKVDAAVDAALEAWEKGERKAGAGRGQGSLFGAHVQLTLEDDTRQIRRRSVVERLEEFLKRHTRADELGLRLRGEQLAAGVRFARMLREGQYHLVVGNPPYQGTSKMEGGEYLARHYPEGKADLYAAFMLRGQQLLGQDGIAALLTMRGWMFIGTYEGFRKRILQEASLDILVDLDRGAFSEIAAGPGGVAACITLFRRGTSHDGNSLALQPSDRRDITGLGLLARKRAALLAGVGRHTFHPARLKVVPGWPLIYWWDEEFLARYAATPKLGEVSPARKGIDTGNNLRFVRRSSEIAHQHRCDAPTVGINPCFQPYIKGSEGAQWFEPLRNVVQWKTNGLQIKVFAEFSTGANIRNPQRFFHKGIAFTPIGAVCRSRLHRFPGICDNMGTSVYPEDLNTLICLMNSNIAGSILSSLNPTVHFQISDVNRLPLFPIESADEIVARLDQAFTEHEAHRETSVEFRHPGPSCWTWAQAWAQAAVDRPAGAPLPPWEPVHTQATPLDHLSFALGVALGRLGAHGEGILDEAPASALPHGILFMAPSGSASGLGGGAGAFGASSGDSLAHPACAPLHDAWAAHGARIAPKATLHEYLRLRFFADDHLKRYEKRPIYFPLSSEKKNFVAWISIHRWRDDTLQVLLADHLQPALSRLSGELADLSEARTSGDRQDQARAEARAAEVQALHEELRAFVHLVEEVAEKGAPRTGKAPAREVDARFRMDSDDGVMINSAALWPLLKPQWKDPEKWWAELAEAQGKKDYDWSHLAARYFPKRVDGKCQQDPSLAVAHGVFWKYHPAKAFQWELRLQAPDELGPDFRLDEPGSDLYREDFQRQHPDQVRELREAEERRRHRKADKTGDEEGPSEGELDFEGED